MTALASAFAWLPLAVLVAAGVASAQSSSPLGALPVPELSSPSPPTAEAEPPDVPPEVPALPNPLSPLLAPAAPDKGVAGAPAAGIPVGPAERAAAAGWAVLVVHQLGGGLEALRSRLATPGMPRVWRPQAALETLQIGAAGRSLRLQDLGGAVRADLKAHPGVTLAWLAQDLHVPRRKLRPVLRRLRRSAQVRGQGLWPARRYYPGPARPR